MEVKGKDLLKEQIEKHQKNQLKITIEGERASGKSITLGYILEHLKNLGYDIQSGGQGDNKEWIYVKDEYYGDEGLDKIQEELKEAERDHINLKIQIDLLLEKQSQLNNRKFIDKKIN